MAELFPVLSTLFFTAGAVFGAGRWLWKRFENRMDRGDILSLERDDTIIGKLDALEVARKADQELNTGRINALELQQARIAGETSVLISLLGGNLTHILPRKDGE